MSDAFEIPALLRESTRLRFRLSTGIEIAAIDFGGDGPLALLHHANGFCAGVWGLVVERLQPRLRMIAIDARGHGDSSKPRDPEAYRWDHFAGDLVEVADQVLARFAAPRFALGLGHSFGGTATLVAAARRPDLFERLVLVDPVIPPPPSVDIPEARRAHVNTLADAARARAMVRPSRADAVRAWSTRKFFSRWDPRALALYAADGLFDRPDGQVEHKCPGEIEAMIFEQSGSLDVASHASQVQAPTLFLRARYGDFPLALYQALAAKMRDGCVEEVDAGHLMPMERPDLVADATLAHLARTLPGDRTGARDLAHAGGEARSRRES